MPADFSTKIITCIYIAGHEPAFLYIAYIYIRVCIYRQNNGCNGVDIIGLQGLLLNKRFLLVERQTCAFQDKGGPVKGSHKPQSPIPWCHYVRGVNHIQNRFYQFPDMTTDIKSHNTQPQFSEF